MRGKLFCAHRKLFFIHRKLVCMRGKLFFGHRKPIYTCGKLFCIYRKLFHTNRKLAFTFGNTTNTTKIKITPQKKSVSVSRNGFLKYEFKIINNLKLFHNCHFVNDVFCTSIFVDDEQYVTNVNVDGSLQF